MELLTWLVLAGVLAIVMGTIFQSAHKDEPMTEIIR